MITRSKILLGALVLSTALAAPAVRAEGISNVGVSVGSLGNPYFVALVKGATTQLKTTAPSAKINALSADYDLNKQFSQMDSFVASGVNLILLNGVDPQAVMPAIKRVQKSGATVIAVDVALPGLMAQFRPTTWRLDASPASIWPRRSMAKAKSPSRTGLRFRRSSTE